MILLAPSNKSMPSHSRQCVSRLQSEFISWAKICPERHRTGRNYLGIEMPSERHQNGSLIAPLSFKKIAAKTHNKEAKLAIRTGLR